MLSFEESNKLCLEFQKKYSLTNIKKMTLSEYSNAGTKDSFTYWIESLLGEIGSIWGGSSFKFGVYNRVDKTQKKNDSTRSYTDKYAWYKKYGNTAEEAFIEVKKNIIKIIEAVHKKQFELIEDIDLGPSFKWKIAFHYQDFKDPQLIAIFDKAMLDIKKTKRTYTELYCDLIKEKPKDVDIFAFSQNQWEKYKKIKDLNEKKDLSEQELISVKIQFLSYLDKSTPEKSGKPASYSKAMEVIESVFFTDALVKNVDIWGLVTLANIDNIIDIVAKEQKNVDGIFKDYAHPSYWKGGFCLAALKEFKNFLQSGNKLKRGVILKLESLNLPKPFLLLAGISGTGKTRFVREQAKRWNLENNYCLVPVRPDWHEPSDLLGYISRIDGEKYIPTKFLKFIVEAWQHVFENNGSLTDIPAETIPFWLCLDEMNLAPVEQYFADYLSILETRSWEGEEYKCEVIIADNIELIKKSLPDVDNDALWSAFKDNKGIPLPPNLIVAGTVNMDETTHGFSRKVIDRALTLDFQEFFPNDFECFFEGQSEPKTLMFSRLVDARRSSDQIVGADKKNVKDLSRDFLIEINKILKNSPFELAFRAMNELLLAVHCVEIKNIETLQAVYDDFLMQKVLPRIEGDSQKLKSFSEPSNNPDKTSKIDESNYGKGSILHDLYDLLGSDLLKEVWTGSRPDLLRDTENEIDCRSKKKLEWMMKRLKSNHFTDFWV